MCICLFALNVVKTNVISNKVCISLCFGKDLVFFFIVFTGIFFIIAGVEQRIVPPAYEFSQKTFKFSSMYFTSVLGINGAFKTERSILGCSIFQRAIE
jgi:hypothetical protein